MRLSYIPKAFEKLLFALLVVGVIAAIIAFGYFIGAMAESFLKDFFGYERPDHTLYESVLLFACFASTFLAYSLHKRIDSLSSSIDGLHRRLDIVLDQND